MGLLKPLSVIFDHLDVHVSNRHTRLYCDIKSRNFLFVFFLFRKSFNIPWQNFKFIYMSVLSLWDSVKLAVDIKFIKRQKCLFLLASCSFQDRKQLPAFKHNFPRELLWHAIVRVFEIRASLSHHFPIFERLRFLRGNIRLYEPCSLISAFVIPCLDTVIPLVTISKISSIYVALVAEKANSSLTWSQTLNTCIRV